MNKKILLIIAAGIILLVPLFLTGCPKHSDVLYGAKVTGDGSGGAFAVYEDTNSGNTYVQKISAEGKSLWGEQGVLLGSNGSQTHGLSSFDIIYDDTGGAIAVWPGSSRDNFQAASHLTRIGTEGNVLWQRDFSYIDQLLSDGSGGAIICYDQPSSTNMTGEDKDLVIVKIDSDGNYPWGLHGVTVPSQGYQSNTLQIVSDGSGGVIVVWEELESKPASTPGNPIVTNRLLARRIDANGGILWGSNRSLYTTPAGTWIQSPQVSSDGMGGAVVGWFQSTEITPSGNNGQRAQKWDIVTQKIDGNGNVLWQPGGVPLEITKNDESAGPTNPVLAGDNSGGAIVIWRDSRATAANTASVYAQKIDVGGNLKWQAGGTKVSMTSLNPHPLIVSSDSGGAIIIYSFQEDGRILNAQKLDSNGHTLWPENGISIARDGFASDSVISDGQGGVIVTWGVGTNGAFVQRISVDGRLLWGEKGIKLGKK